jgi:hypothetical protein
MAGKLGSDFNAAQPSDDDLVKKGASWMRDIKNRLKVFCGVLFNLESGDFKDNVIGYKKLKDLSPTPAGVGTKVTVNSKGLVTKIEQAETPTASKPKRVHYGMSGGTDPDGAAIARTLGLDGDGRTIATYSYTVPAGITRLMIRMTGAGGGGAKKSAGGAGGGGGAGLWEGVIVVSPSDVFLVWVGQGGAGAGATDNTDGQPGSMTKFQFDSSKKIELGGGGAGTQLAGGAGGSEDPWGYANFGKGRIGTQGSVTAGGLADPFGNGGGGQPASSGTATNGSDGFITITYWSN